MKTLEFKEHGASEVVLIKDNDIMNINFATEESFVSLKLSKIELSLLIVSLTGLIHGEY